MKIRVLTATRKGKVKAMAEDLATWAANGIYKADIIPPAYSCENERLIILLVTPGSIPNKDDFARFIQGLNRQRARNVAIAVDGTPDDVAEMIDTIKKNDVNVVEPVLTVDGGLPAPLSFLSKTKPEEKESLKAWYEDVLTKLA